MKLVVQSLLKDIDSKSEPVFTLINPISILPGGIDGNNFLNVSRLVMRFPSAPKEGPRVTKPATLTLFPATSVSTIRPSLYQLGIGPNSFLESLGYDVVDLTWSRRTRGPCLHTIDLEVGLQML